MHLADLILPHSLNFNKPIYTWFWALCKTEGKTIKTTNRDEKKQNVITASRLLQFLWWTEKDCWGVIQMQLGALEKFFEQHSTLTDTVIDLQNFILDQKFHEKLVDCHGNQYR